MDESNVGAAEGSEQLGDFLGVELGVVGFDGDEEAIVGDFLKQVPVEERVVVAGESVEREHSEDGGKSGEEDGELEHDGEESWDGEEVGGFASDGEGVNGDGGDELEEDSGEEAGSAAKEDDFAEDGAAESHGLVHAVDGEGGISVPAAEAEVADFLRGMEEGWDVGEERSNGVKATLGVAGDGGLDGRGILRLHRR